MVNFRPLIEILFLLFSGINLGVYCYVVPQVHHSSTSTAPATEYLPVVIWHGLGDSYNSPGILNFISEIQGFFPGIYVYSVYLDEDGDADRKASWYGNLNNQVVSVTRQLKAIPELQGGFTAIGVSQVQQETGLGGQIWRAYIERFNDPPVHSLITFGSQHMGISKSADCEPGDFLCQSVQRVIRFGVYNSWVQNSIVPAQYFRDPLRIETYLDSSNFLADINNERPLSRNRTYADNLASLEKLVLVLFNEDETVIPKESSWFGSYTLSDVSDSQNLTIIPMQQQPLYTEDWIGLKKLDSEGRIKLIACEGGHLHYSECWDTVIKQYSGVPKPNDSYESH